MTPERDAIERGWYYLRTPDGLVRRAHGYAARLVVDDPGLSRAARVQEASRRGRALEGTPCPPPDPVQGGEPTARVLFFESLMNSDMPHNDREISQGVLHMVAPLRERGTEVVLANLKMAIEGEARPLVGVANLDQALEQPVGLICITLLEGYWEGVEQLIAAIRARGSRAHIAVGGVMPTLAPEHVAAHLDGVSFICRGAGEVFVPQLVDLGCVDIDTPFTPAQRQGLLAMDGLLAFDPAGALIAARPDRVVKVADLSRVDLDLSHVQRRHVLDGIEIATSRGCVHRCTFCSILGRETYQARSSESVLALLGRYHDRLVELFPEGVPAQALRVHFSDDDFACDSERAQQLFADILTTPFRLASVQVSIADLSGDTKLLDSIRPECFHDHGRHFPARDFVKDHASRTWSSYLQIGVESFADVELVRLGKGYRVEQVRQVAAELGRRGLHWDAYIILSNAETTAEQLVESLSEIARLKLRFPTHFHARFPVVPHLVSYFTAASHRRLIRQGQEDRLVVRRTLAHADAPELDYPLVDHDLPADALVASAVQAQVFTDEGYYSGALERLRDHWIAQLPDADEPRRVEALVRQLDQAPRRLALDLLKGAREHDRRGWPDYEPVVDDVLRVARPLAGATWKADLKRWCEQSTPRLVLIPTWQCELRCRYCFIPKQDGRVMSVETAERGIELLLSSERPSLMLQFFGGEALLEWELLQHAIAYADRRAQERGKDLSFVLSSNGWSLDEAKLAWLLQFPVKLELSLDGAPDLQNRFRRALQKGGDSYQMGIAPRARAIQDSGVPYDVIMVVHPENAARVDESFKHLASLGFSRLQINHALGYRWTDEQMTTLAQGLHRVGQWLRSPEGAHVTLVNAEHAPMPVRLNGEITVDHDGTVYGGNGFLHETEHKDRFRVGHLDDLHGFDRYWLDAPHNDYLLRWSYPEDVTDNNLKLGRVMASFVKWLRGSAA